MLSLPLPSSPGPSPTHQGCFLSISHLLTSLIFTAPPPAQVTHKALVGLAYWLASLCPFLVLWNPCPRATMETIHPHPDNSGYFKYRPDWASKTLRTSDLCVWVCVLSFPVSAPASLPLHHYTPALCALSVTGFVPRHLCRLFLCLQYFPASACTHILPPPLPPPANFIQTSSISLSATSLDFLWLSSLN